MIRCGRILVAVLLMILATISAVGSEVGLEVNSAANISVDGKLVRGMLLASVSTTGTSVDGNAQELEALNAVQATISSFAPGLTKNVSIERNGQAPDWPFSGVINYGHSLQYWNIETGLFSEVSLGNSSLSSGCSPALYANDRYSEVHFTGAPDTVFRIQSSTTTTNT
ncbi:MAG: hypothetical protein OXI96_06215 [Acidimicrobiaceae bacterium]|nr:hypothetical protein [Acidimicrobiaceae bacterium]